MTPSTSQHRSSHSPSPSPQSSNIGWAIWGIIAAFGTYFCMYAFRKPFTAASYADSSLFNIDFKTILVASQVAGYTISKFLGIKIISEMTPARRGVAILVLIAIAQVSLIAFGLLPRPWNAIALFFNGLPLGMVFGLVLGFLEGRRITEVLTAGLCASFILADGVVKSVGAWLLASGVREDWMPAAAGAIFIAPILLGVWMLTKIPQPDPADIAARAERTSLNKQERRALLYRYATGIFLIGLMYLILTIVRSIRADFAPEIWKGLGSLTPPAIFSQSESIVALGVLVIFGATVFIRNNARAFHTSMGICAAGGLLLIIALIGHQTQSIGGFALMTLTGLGMYLPYVAMNTSVFERMLAMTRERGNMGFLMYVVDAIGYLGYVGVIVYKSAASPKGSMLDLFTLSCWIAAICTLACALGASIYFARRTQGVNQPVLTPQSSM